MWQVSSETGRLTDVLLCPPSHYRWVPTNSIVRRTLAAGGTTPNQAELALQHGELRDALREAGVRVHLLPPEPHLPYMAYTRDPAIITPWGPVLGQLERPQRRGEYASYIRFFEGHAWRMSSAGTLEGGDVHIIREGLALIGCSGGRTDEAGAEQLAGWLRDEGWEVRVEHFDEHFLHLDVLFCMAAPGLALAAREILGPDFLAWLTKHGIRTIDVTYNEVMHLGANIVALGGERVISALESVRINQALRAEGLKVLDPALSFFTMGGGGPHCLTCPLIREG